MRNARILIVDAVDARGNYQQLSDLEGIELFYAASAGAALDQLTPGAFDLLIAAHNPPELEAIELLLRVRQMDEALAAIIVAAQPSIASARAALRAGADDYLPTSLAADELSAATRRLLDAGRQRRQAGWLPRQPPGLGFEEFIGGSPAMQKVFETIEQVAELEVDVLVQGETGAGKELVARAIHRRSRRASGPFVPVDCGAIPENLLESEFFGHERGAFTGAHARRIGLLEFADGGTFFLDELGELPLLLQAKLLRTLQERKIRRLGGREEIGVDLRIVAATSRDLLEMIRQGLFREDLYYRVNVVRIELPPLRDRGDDLGLLAERFVVRYAKEMGKRVTGITPEAFQVLRQYEWPGNVRELQNIVRRSIALSRQSLIGLEDLPDALVLRAGEKRSADSPGFFQLREAQVARFEREYLRDLLGRHRGNVKSAAEEAKLPRGTLYRIMKNHGLDSAEFR
jgi:DNA-binding NtrC family response regulator